MEFLLMGGQACILYGAAEFSRDLDISLRIDEDNLEQLRQALVELEAELIYVPPLSREALEAGHACHFRCNAAEAAGIRLDVMGRQRGVAGWTDLWSRRTELDVPGVGRVALMGLGDLVQAKKTQRDKDWPMIRRLIEADLQAQADHPEPDQIRFWLEECRTPEVLIELVNLYPELAGPVAERRVATGAARSGDPEAVRKALQHEEELERRRDREYWAPLRKQLEAMRHAARRPPDGSDDPSG